MWGSHEGLSAVSDKKWQTATLNFLKVNVKVIEIKPVTGKIDAVVNVPGSKSYTNRALITAALAEGESTITKALFSDDTKYMASGLNTLGIPVSEDRNTSRFVVSGN